MKDFREIFSRRYSAVASSAVVEDEQHLACCPTDVTFTGAQTPATLLQRTALADEQRRRRKSFKSLGNSRMNPAGILSSFFNERQQNKRARAPKCAFLLLAIGVLAITTAVLVKIFQPYDSIFKWKLTMSDDGEIFNLWAKPPVDLYIKIYLFNVTNAEAFLAGRERMNVAQVGPYVYKEIMTHENITFNENGTMSTNPSHPLVWQEHLSEGRREDDQVVMLNIAMLAIAHLTADKSFLARMALKTLLHTSNSKPLVRMTAKEFMFGYYSSLTTLGNTFLPNWISFDTVGLIDRMYDFNNDYETFYTGVGNPSISGLYATYRGSKDLPQWEGDHCSNIELASDGTKFRSFLQQNDSVKFFRKSMCRPINLYRVGEEQQHGSLTGYRYVFEENAFDNGRQNPANKCFCREGKCQPQGLIDVTKCYYGFPISLSYPHFMGGDEGLQNNITGVKPDPAIHSSAFVIQPESGLPLSISAKVQINMHFNDMSAFSQVAAFSHLTAPMLWFDIMMPELPSALDTRFNFYLNVLPYLDILGFWGGLALGVALLVYAVTRATIRISTFTQGGGISTQASKYDYGKANMLRPMGGVYNPCELTLMHTHDEKTSMSAVQQQIRCTSESSSEKAEDIVSTAEEAQNLYTAIDMRQRKSFALELEPALSDSDEDEDEGNESDTLTCSRNSTSSSCVEDDQEEHHCKEANKLSGSFGSSGLASSIADSHEEDSHSMDQSTGSTQSGACNSNWSLDAANNTTQATAQVATTVNPSTQEVNHNNLSRNVYKI